MNSRATSSEKHSARAVRATIWSAVNAVIPLITGFGVFVVTSHHLTPSEFGTVALASGISIIGSVAIPSGFGESIVQASAISPRQLDAVFWLCTACACIIYLLQCAAASQISHFFEITSMQRLLPVLSVQIIANSIAVVPNALISRSLAFHLFAIRSLAVSVVVAVLTVALLLKGYGIWALVSAQVTGSLVTMIASFLTAKWRPRMSFHWSELRDIAAYGLYASGTQNMNLLFTQNEQILVGYFLGTGELGFYNFAKRVISIFNNVVAGSLGNVVHPMFASIRSDPDRVRRGFLQASFVSSTVSFPIFIGLAAISDRLVPIIFGARWESAVALVKIQCALGLIASIGSLQAGLITSYGKANWWFRYQLLTLLSTVAVIILFARYGLVVMMSALVIKTYLLWFSPVRDSLHLLAMRPDRYLMNFRAPLAGAFCMVLAIMAERHFFAPAAGMTGLCRDVMCGAVIYSGVVFLVERPRLLSLMHLLRPSRKAGAQAPEF